MRTEVRDWDLKDIVVDRFACFDKELNEEVVGGFSNIVGDISPLHVDVDYGTRTPYKGNIVHGMLTAGLFSTMVGVLLPGRKALLHEVSVRFIRPVLVGSRVTVTGVVTGLLPAGRGIRLRLIAYKSGEVCVKGEALVGLRQPLETGARPEGVDLENLWEGTPEDLKTALITGGSGLVGRALCEKLAADGWRVGIHYNQNRKAAEETLCSIKGKGGVGCILKANIGGESAEVEQLASVCKEELGPVGLLVHAACAPFTPTGWFGTESGSDIYTTQVRGFQSLLKPILPDMLRSQCGCVLVLLSDAVNPPHPRGWQSYIAAKSALQAMTGVLASDYEDCGLIIGSISPGEMEGDSSVVREFDDGLVTFEGSDSMAPKVSPAILANVVSSLVNGDLDFPNGSSLSLRSDNDPRVFVRSLLIEDRTQLPEDGGYSHVDLEEDNSPLRDLTQSENEEMSDGEMRLTEVFRRILQVEDGTQVENAELGSFPRWDSLTHLKLLMEVEEEFDITLENAEQLYSFKSLLEAVCSY